MTLTRREQRIRELIYTIPEFRFTIVGIKMKLITKDDIITEIVKYPDFMSKSGFTKDEMIKVFSDIVDEELRGNK